MCIFKMSAITKEIEVLRNRVELLEEQNRLLFSILDQIKTAYNSFPDGIDIEHIDYIGQIISNNV